MRIALVGGIFGNEAGLALGRITPETVLAEGLRAAGHDVATFSHYQRVEADDVDVVHVHHLSFGALAMAFDPSRTPFVFTSHDPRAMSSLLPVGRRLALSVVLSRVDVAVALSGTEAAFSRHAYGLTHERLEVIPNGQPAGVFTFGRSNLCGADGIWRLMYAGQLVPLKRVDVLLRAVARLPKNVHLDLVYHVDHERDRLQHLAVELGIEKRVRFRGSFGPIALRDAYARCDLFVLPSAGEALPTVLIEAMLCGAPVIATDVGGVREQVGEHGTVVQPDSVDELTAAIQRTLDRYPAVHAGSRARSEYARERFSVRTMIDRHVALYGRIAGSYPMRARSVIRRATNRVGTPIVGVATLQGLSTHLPTFR